MWRSILADGHDGSLSSKRIVTFAAFVLCCIAFMSNLFFNYKIDQFLYDSMMYIVVAGLAVTASEKFASKNNNKGD